MVEGVQQGPVLVGNFFRTGCPEVHQGQGPGYPAPAGSLIHMPVQGGCLLGRIGLHHVGRSHISHPTPSCS